MTALDCLSVEVDMGSAISWDRPAEQAWLVRLRRGERSLIVAGGLSRRCAQSLAERIADLAAGACLKSPPTGPVR